MREVAGRAALAEAQALLVQRKVEAALAQFDEAERRGADPDECAAGRWEGLMLLGRFAEAWLESDAIAERGNPDPFRFWDGESWAGKNVLVRCLHGLGDTLNFVRFLKPLRTDACHVSLEAQPPLKELMQATKVADHVLTWGEREPPWQVQMEINELPRIFRVTELALSTCHPKLQLPVLEQPAAVLGSELLNVGLVWASGAFNPLRSVPVQILDELIATAGVRWHGLQAGGQHIDAQRWSNCNFIQHCGEEPRLLDLARLTANLDLLITVDTMNAHLGGALGVPTWTMLPYVSDWRWMLRRPDSPWYPSMRLFRQESPGDWASVITRVKPELEFLIRKRALEA